MDHLTWRELELGDILLDIDVSPHTPQWLIVDVSPWSVRMLGLDSQEVLSCIRDDTVLLDYGWRVLRVERAIPPVGGLL